MLIPLSMKLVGINDEGIQPEIADPGNYPAFVLTFLLDEAVISGVYAENYFFEFAPNSKIIKHEKNDPVLDAAERVLAHYASGLVDGQHEIKSELKHARDIGNGA